MTLTLTDLVLQSIPICLVVTVVMVALEEDELRPYLWHCGRYFSSMYGGILAFAAALYGIDRLAG